MSAATTLFCAIGIGGNLGERRQTLAQGIALLAEAAGQGAGLEVASLYETAPVDCAPGTPSFYNSVLTLHWSGPASDLHARLQAIEQAMGRPAQRERNSPRPLDLDLLFAGHLQSDDPQLILPHPRLHLRRFVLEPLAELCPEWELPGLGRCVQQCLAALSPSQNSQELRRIAARGWHDLP